jgi:hypothetical protein
VKILLRNMVSKVARRLNIQNRRQDRTKPKDATANTSDSDTYRTRNTRRRGQNRLANGDSTTQSTDYI